MSGFRRDLQRADIVGQLFDESLYPQYFPQTRRIFEKSMQKEGIDVIATTPEGQEILIDEKVSVAYLNDPPNHFWFEVSYLDSEQSQRVGWFMNKELKTEMYVLGFIHKSTPEAEENLSSHKQLLHTEVLFIPKGKILHYLNEIGIGLNKIRQANQTLRFQPHMKCVRLGANGRVWVSRSDRYSECPINLMIGKEILIDMAVARVEIFNDDPAEEVEGFTTDFSESSF